MSSILTGHAASNNRTLFGSKAGSKKSGGGGKLTTSHFGESNGQGHPDGAIGLNEQQMLNGAQMLQERLARYENE